MEGAKSKQDRKQLSLLSHLPAELQRSLVNRSNFHCAVAPPGYQSGTKHHLEGQLLLSTLRRVRQSPQYLQRLGEVVGRLRVRRSLDGLLRSKSQVFHRLLFVGAATVMMSEISVVGFLPRFEESFDLTFRT